MKTKKELLEIEVTKLELALRKFLKKKKKEVLGDFRVRSHVEEVREKYLLNEKTILMFRACGLIKDYTAILKDFNKFLDRDYG